ncbi:ABC transporter permease [Labrys wisconsinensis]|uniref:Ribose transport system permease protein n=1 Tax=Labrys wisconsinensis TaxID=425677 RepID=A0ABU0J8K4_9HYPH|nr:ABC transporter permease [Labrys wisconsinensis]MDQ0470603.1 ribose transport system permease protein [Labrys wisconsinensis]
MSNALSSKWAESGGLSAPFWRLFDRVGPLLLLATIILAVTAIRPSFLTSANLMTIGLQASVNALLAIGQTLVIVSGGIELSVGTMMSLSMVVMAFSTLTFGVPMPLSMMIAVLFGVAGGAINGFLVAYGRIPAFIATLGMLGIAQGTALKLSGGYAMYGFPDWFDFIGNGELVGIPFPIWIVATVAVLAHYLFTQRPMGRYAFAMGASEESVRRAGVDVRRLKLRIYMACGVTVGCAAIVLASRIDSAHPGIGLGYELDAIAASVIGGASLMGGRGSVLGAISGALVMATIRFALNLFGMEPFLQQIVVGVVLIGAVYLDTVRVAQEERRTKVRARHH